MRSLFRVIFASILISAAARANSIHFVQDGWTSGATLSVAFSGQDVNDDGALTLPELSAFHAEWLTPSGKATSWKFADIQPDGFLFSDLGNYLFFTVNAEFSLVSTAFEGEALASIFDSSLFPVDDTVSPPTAAPEPMGMAAAGLGVLWLCARVRRKFLKQSTALSI